VYDSICRLDAACRDLYANAGAERASVVADVADALDYYRRLTSSGQRLPFWAEGTVVVPSAAGPLLTNASDCAVALADAAAGTLSGPVLMVLDALIRYRAYLQTNGCIDPLKQMVFDTTTGIGTCVYGMDVKGAAMTAADDLSNALAEAVAITFVVATVLFLLASVVLAARIIRLTERTARQLDRNTARANADDDDDDDEADEADEDEASGASMDMRSLTTLVY
jgi:hypothetical protein